MPETTSNIEFAQRIHEQGHHGGGGSHAGEWLELVEALVLAAVAVLTAWSGYQAAKWDAKSSAAYALASSRTARAQGLFTLAGQDRLYDIATFNSWLTATLRKEDKLADMLERRFRPEFEVAYKAWAKTDPFVNSNAPPGPSFMAEYRDARTEQAESMAAQAKDSYETGLKSRATGDEYVRITVVLATVLLLTALSQRFKIHAARVSLVGVAFVMLGFAVYWIVTFPRA
jgi:hypothetical protein